MRYERVFLEGLEVLVPPVEVLTADLERELAPLYRRLGVPATVLESLTGVRARRFWPEGRLAADAAAEVARRALAHAPAPVEAVISTSVYKDYLEPPIASLVAGDLGLPDGVVSFDVGHACLGFLTGLVTAANLVELGQIGCALVVAGEGSRGVTRATVERLLRPGTDFRTFAENLATLTLGSMAVAALVVHERHGRAGHRLLGGVMRSAPRHSRLCLGTATEMRTDATALLREGVALAAATYDAVRAELALGEVAEYALHQVGKANHDALVARLALPEARVLRLYPEHGNVGAAGVPSTLHAAVAQGRVRPGDTALLMGIGSGLNCTMLGVTW